MTPLARTPLARVRFLRALVTWSVALLLLGDVWHLPHLLLVRHVVCGEHGELVHDHDGPAVPEATADGEPVSRVSSGQPAVHEHQHCSAVATSMRDHAVTGVTGCTVALATTVPQLLLADSPSEARLPLGVLTYAPKHGPPARA